ncbi:thioredoxin family protein [Salarchaeum sp. JOR-1]|uniref:TlpA family protein disulfide reductase n=1 Tax=Salarchaeum sp. JOR-1 TaxID=2599399 RepID=UPI001198C9C2|nr:thioredoxin family protein [Salarchaeum sp. JOR-1]QDX41634.1 thioredoxin [Salarchaeum sp. JOR-1]
MTLDCMTPAREWDEAAHEDAVKTLASLDDSTHVRVWGADWCPDCTEQLPEFAAALAAAGVSHDRISTYPVERENGVKTGPKMAEYEVSLIPTVLVEDADGDELARFVEEEDQPIAEYLASELRAITA